LVRCLHPRSKPLLALPVPSTHAAEPELGRKLVQVISAEDTIPGKLRRYQEGGEVSKRQRRDIAGILVIY